MHATVVVLHIAAAVLALVVGPLAVRFPNGTPRHRGLGRSYVVAWIAFGTTGFYLGAIRPGITPFEVLNVLGAAFVLAALYPIWKRESIGPRWKRQHYRNMLISYAFVAVASINQAVSRAGVEYPLWMFGLIAFTPFLVIPRVIRRLDAAYGFAAREEEL
jgi:uncharacterized membrane protein